MNTSYWETKRKQLALVKEQYASNGRKPIIVDSIIRAEVSMSANQQNFVFNLGETNGGTTFNTETRLALNDGFSIFEVGVFVAKPSSGTASNFKLYTYPNAGVFSTSNVASSLDGFFNNGSLNVQKDQVNYLQNFPLLFNRFVPEVQDGLTYGYTTTGATAPNGLDSFDGNEDGFTPLAAYINITGRDSLNVNIQIPTGLAAVETNQRAILIFKGYKAYNVAR
jgi:hypothetical protein